MQKKPVKILSSGPLLNIAHIVKGSRANGPGLRDVIWVQGCSRHCEGCQNLELQSHIRRYILPVSTLIGQIAARKDQIEGVTISGGEPLEQPAGLAELMEMVHELGLSTMVYTGFEYDEIYDSSNPQIQRILSATDILIDGPFILSKKTQSVPWVGSSNQRVICLTSRYSKNEIGEMDICVQECFIFPSVLGDFTIINTGIQQ
ncbi:MAG: 4Fe-4S single cluster domain-containing protein [Methanoregula sp.]|uniref:4Fe-4S single cluster domain-containing protein n=1 Tax=Methanoregula sp. TaxID=2052170 RepID=UPI003D0AD6BE